jgi:hypothetical protein
MRLGLALTKYAPTSSPPITISHGALLRIPDGVGSGVMTVHAAAAAKAFGQEEEEEGRRHYYL